MKTRPFSVLLCLLLFSALTYAQVQKGTITGSVVDQQGSAVPEAKITVRDMQTSGLYNAVSGKEGEFTVPGLAFGTYQVIIEKEGFRKWETTNVAVVTAQESSVKATLQLGVSTESVFVEAAQTVIDTTSAELTTNVNRKQIVDLPLVSRNPMELATLQAGVTGATGTRTSVFNGLRGSTNNITQDGVNIQDNFIKSDGFFAQSAPTVENTGEFSISSQNIGSDSGFGVAQIRITTPRGTNDLHGSIFYFHRNDAFNANDFVSNELGSRKDKLRQHRFGGNVGGPVFLPKIYNGTGKTFFFFRYEGFRENLSAQRDRTVLTESARRGLFSYVDRGGARHTVDLISASSRKLPINPFTKSLIDATPLPNNTSRGDGDNFSGFRFLSRGSNPDDRYTLRFDHKAIESHRWGTHWIEVDANWSNFFIRPDFGNSTDPAFPAGVAASCTGGVCAGKSQFPKRRQLSTAINSTLGATMFNEFRFAFFRPFSSFLRDSKFPRSFQVAFPTLISNPEQNSLDSGRFTPTYTFIDNFTKVRGAHTIKAGFQVISTSSRPFSDSGTLPTVTIGSNANNNDGLTIGSFPGLVATDSASVQTFNRARSIYQALVGLEDTVQQTFNAVNPTLGFIPGATNAESYKLRTYALYASDSWRIRSSLTANYGLRYELSPAVDIVNNRGIQPVNFTQGLFLSGPVFQVNPGVTFGDLLSGKVAPTQLVPAGSNGKPLWNTDKKDFAPFIGVAWQPTSKTVIRSGFSVSYTREGIDVAANAVTGNSGLQTTSKRIVDSSSADLGVISSSTNFALPAPPLKLPISQLQNFIQGSGTGSTLFTFDHNLKNPYVLQWSFGIERELSNSTALEIRYVGNHAVRLLRGIDFNQINLTPDLLTEFNTAASNLAICNANRRACTGSASGTPGFDNRGLAGQLPLPLLESIKIPPAFFTDNNFLSDLRNNAAGNFWFNLQNLCTFRFFNNVDNVPGKTCPGLASRPANLFVANPLAFGADALTNGSSSTYHGLQMEFRRRLTAGVQLQGNYTFSKVLTDSSGSATNFDAFLDLNHRRFDRTRALFDVRHTFHLNGIWELPVGRGRRYASTGVFGKVLEGWQTGAIWTWHSGAPFTIASGFGTINRAARSTTKSTAVPVGMTAADVCAQVGVHKTSNGVFFLPENFLVRNSGGVTGADSKFLTNPGPGQLGDQGFNLGCSGPGYVNIDMNLVKRTRITERVNFEFRWLC